MDVSQLWSFLFFFMMINLALSSICRQVLTKNIQYRHEFNYIYSVYSGVQTFMAFMLDEKPEWTQHRLKILIGSSAVYFLLALPMCSKVPHHYLAVH